MGTARWRVALMTTILAAVLVGAPRDSFALYSSGYCTSNVTCSNWNVGTSNGLIQHPEIVLIFWQDLAEQWANGNGGSPNPTQTQLVGSSLALINSPYYNALSYYGVAGGGYIARPEWRLKCRLLQARRQASQTRQRRAFRRPSSKA